MSYDIRNVQNINHLIIYFSKVLNWNIDTDSFENIDDIAYDFSAADLGLKEEAFAKIKSIKQLPPMVDGQKWGIFCIEFDSKRFEVTALRKVLSGLVPSRRNSANHAVWDKADLLFLCFWGEDDNRTIGLAHFEDKQNGLPQIKMTYCAPAIEDSVRIQDFVIKIENLKWPVEVDNFQRWHDDWSKAFTTSYKQTIHDSKTLTMQLAKEALAIRDRILETLKIETDVGYVHQLFRKFKETLIHDMSEKEFSDMYAQTVVYGLFSARCMDETQESFSADEAIECIPNTNPFLKSLMKECFGNRENSKLSFDELEIDNVVDLLKHTNTDEIIQDFNRQTGGGKEDPVIHFYEEFLSEYDKSLKFDRGVFYTPQPVVNFMVRAIDYIIKKDFELEDGLASIETKRIKYKRNSKYLVDGYHYKEVEDIKEVPAIQVLDPATGTGTFIRQIILQINDNFKTRNYGLNDDELHFKWNQYVPKHLLPRLNAFELMMAPYAVTHMKLAMVLRDTGYDFKDTERLHVYLTNSLEEAGGSDHQISIFDDPLANESVAANVAKKNAGINVVIGNPPYNGKSSNKSDWIMKLMETYKKEPGGIVKLQERNPKWLNNDYVKFIRFAQFIIEKSGEGILSYICPHRFIDNSTFRGMRWSLLHCFSKIYVIDLHGSAKKIETCPDGSKDENIFDIKEGVCIVIAVKNKKRNNTLAEVYHSDLFGSRSVKLEYLNKTLLNEVPFEKVNLVEPQYFFVPKDFSLYSVYSEFISIDDIFTQKTVGVVSANDKVLIDYESDNLIHKVEECYGCYSDYSLIENIAYRPFDDRKIYYDVRLLERPREEIMSNFRYGKNNFGICLTKVTAVGNTYRNCFITNKMIDSCFVSNRTSEITYVYPLYSYCGEMTFANLSTSYIKLLESRLGIDYCEFDSCSDNTFSALDVMDYVYAILFSQNFRDRYVEFLKIDFPKIPIPKDLKEFLTYTNYGRLLRNAHLLSDDGLFSDINLVGNGTMTVDHLSYKPNRIYINKEQFIESVCYEEWNFDIGAYKPLQKWLKDRKGRELSQEEIQQYFRIISAIRKTIEIMREIDLVTE